MSGMIEDEVAKIIMKVEGEEDVKRLSAEIAKEEKELRELISQLKAQHEAAEKARRAQEQDDREQERAEQHAEKESRHNEEVRGKWEFEGRDSKEIDRERERAEAEDKRKARDRLGAAKDSAPGIEGLIRQQLINMGNSNAAAGGLADRLRPRFGAEADALVGEQRGGAQEKLMADWLKGPDVDRRMSRVIGASDLADSIQSGVGDDTAKRQLEEAQKTNVLLDKIAGGGAGGGRGIAFGANGNLEVR